MKAKELTWIDKFFDQFELFFLTQLPVLLKQVRHSLWGFILGFLLCIIVIFSLYFYMPVPLSIGEVAWKFFFSVVSLSILNVAFTLITAGFLLQTDLQFCYKDKIGKITMYQGIASNKFIWVAFLLIASFVFSGFGVPWFVFPLTLLVQFLPFFFKDAGNIGRHLVLPLVNGVFLVWGFVVVAHYMSYIYSLPM